MKMNVNVKLIIVEILLATGILSIIYGAFNLLLLIQAFSNFLAQGQNFMDIVSSNVDFIFNIITVIGSGLAQLIASWLLGETFAKKTVQNSKEK
jgi:ABC-type phosphate transport system permease subunit